MNNNDKIKKALQALVSAGKVKDFQILVGFAVKVYQDGEEGYGTFDFQSSDGELYIPGVSVSAIDANRRGELLIPAEDSDVTIALIGGTDAYVLHYSHIGSAIFDTDKSIKIGATGIEDTDDETDYDEVAETGIKTVTEHKPESINSQAIDQSGSNDKSNIVNRTADASESTVADAGTSKSTKITQSSTEVKIEAGNASISQTENGADIKGQQVVISNGGLTEEAVLGQKLKLVLSHIITQMGLIVTATAMGPQPLLNKAAVDALQSELDTIMSAVVKIE